MKEAVALSRIGIFDVIEDNLRLTNSSAVGELKDRNQSSVDIQMPLSFLA
jgi:hypothetical protein